MDVIESGTNMELNKEHSEKIPPLIIVTEHGIVIEVNVMHPAKARSQIAVTLMSISYKPLLDSLQWISWDISFFISTSSMNTVWIL